ncbi:HAD-IA family hydrolase [Streptomyces sp. NPDC017405]|uniref:HAD-IA family hydrolase n=1 Tax=unclassified Streptomyces TaxID=2593676 RepID=UPI003798262B
MTGAPSRVGTGPRALPDAAELTCRAVLFDLDGVLVRSEAVVERSWTAWARGRGLDPADVLAACHGRRSVEVIAAFAPDLDAEAEAARLEAGQAEDIDGLARCAGADTVLAALSGAPWAVVTSGSRALAVSRLRGTGLPVPDVLITADDVERGKPAPDGYLAASAALGVPPADCVVVEDARPGVLAARAAGMRVVGVSGTALGRQEPLDRVVGTVGDLAPRTEAGHVVLLGGAPRPARTVRTGPSHTGPAAPAGPAHDPGTPSKEAS